MLVVALLVVLLTPLKSFFLVIFGNWKQLQHLIQFSDDLNRLVIPIVSKFSIFAALYLISSLTSFEFFQSMAQLLKLQLLRTFIKRPPTKISMDRCLGTGDPLMKKEEKCFFLYKKKLVKKKHLFKAQNSQSIVSQQNRGRKKKDVLIDWRQLEPRTYSKQNRFSCIY